MRKSGENKASGTAVAGVHGIVDAGTFSGNGHNGHNVSPVQTGAAFRVHELVAAAFDAEDPPFDEGFGHGAPRLGEGASVGVPRDAAASGRVAGVQAFQIREPQRLKTLHSERHCFGFGKGNAAGSEECRPRSAFHPAAVLWSGHGRTPVCFVYGQDNPGF